MSEPGAVFAASPGIGLAASASAIGGASGAGPPVTQPDFTKLFFDISGGQPRKVRYVLRQGAYLPHDLAFLDSLTHDARFRRKDVRLRGNRISMRLERQCWEIDRFGRDMYVARSELAISGVVSVRWTFHQGTHFAPADELWIRSLTLVDSWPSENVSLAISGSGWRCLLGSSETDLVVRLQDHEVPRPTAKRRRSSRRARHNQG
jgi:hypothetical protein